MLIFADYRRRLARGGARNPATPAERHEHDLKAWLAPSRTALLLIDMQVDFAVARGALGSRAMT